MKRIAIMLIALTVLLGAEVRVSDTQTLDLANNTVMPVFSADGKHLLFNSLEGLQQYEIGSRKMTRIADSGFDYTMDREGRIRFRVDSFEDGMRMNSVYLYDSGTKNTEKIIESKRLDIVPKITDHGVYYIENAQIRSNLEKTSEPSRPVAFSYERAILLYSYGTAKMMKPAGEDKFYVWPSVSPDGKQLCFVDINDLYVTDLNGALRFMVKDARAPKWSPDGKWIAFMRDYDDGHVFLSSDIYVVNVETGTEYRLTDSEDKFEMFPSWSPDGKQIVCEDAAHDDLVLITLDIR
ncbi:MAG: PD40 domain-containing protein [Candidatus Marinimicrobia bacterium]|nr:PD40 domain-containing protein [Candidatus Neomarinimicrobiota bacterium]